MLAKFTPAGGPSTHVPGGTEPSTWLHTLGPYPNVRSNVNAHSLRQPLGFPIAASGMAHSIPVVTPPPAAALHPAVTPATLLLSSVTWMPNGFVPPVSVPGPPALCPVPRATCV